MGWWRDEIYSSILKLWNTLDDLKGIKQKLFQVQKVAEVRLLSFCLETKANTSFGKYLIWVL